MRRVLITVIAIAIALPLCAAEADPTQRQRELIVELLELTSGGGKAQPITSVSTALGYAPRRIPLRCASENKAQASAKPANSADYQASWPVGCETQPN